MFMGLSENLKEYFERTGRIAAKAPCNELLAVAEILMEARKNGKWIFAAGNGGSASTASHFANDFVKGLSQKGKTRFKVVAINDSVPILTALSNDYDYSLGFLEQLKNYASGGDVFVVFTGSGNSPNIVKAAEYAKQTGMKVISFTGRDGGAIKDLSDVTCIAATDIMEEIEDAHLNWEHALVYNLRQVISEE
jgi:D-sedoheptulose 7-phosphate isomerase